MDKLTARVRQLLLESLGTGPPDTFSDQEEVEHRVDQVIADHGGPGGLFVQLQYRITEEFPDVTTAELMTALENAIEVSERESIDAMMEGHVRHLANVCCEKASARTDRTDLTVREACEILGDDDPDVIALIDAMIAAKTAQRDIPKQ